MSDTSAHDKERDAHNARTVEQAAELLIKRYGEAALLMATLTADEMVAKRDQPGFAMWLLIKSAIRRRIGRKPSAADQP